MVRGSHPRVPQGIGYTRHSQESRTLALMPGFSEVLFFYLCLPDVRLVLVYIVCIIRFVSIAGQLYYLFVVLRKYQCMLQDMFQDQSREQPWAFSRRFCFLEPLKLQEMHENSHADKHKIFWTLIKLIRDQGHNECFIINKKELRESKFLFKNYVCIYSYIK